MTQPNTAPQPAPAKIDEKCRAYQSTKAQIAALETELTPLKVSLILMTEAHGYIPPNAEKSKRLDGIEMVATVTTGSTVDVVAERVVRLQLALSGAKMSRLFPKLFARETKFKLQKDASDTLAIAIQRLPEKKRADLHMLFASCFDIDIKAPSLAVEEVSVLREKEAAKAAKAAKKASKPAKKK